MTALSPLAFADVIFAVPGTLMAAKEASAGRAKPTSRTSARVVIMDLVFMIFM